MRNFYWQIIIITGKSFSTVTCLQKHPIVTFFFSCSHQKKKKRLYLSFNSDCFHKKLKQLLYRNILEHFISMSYCMIVPLIWKCQHEKSLIHKEFKKYISDFCFVLFWHVIVMLVCQLVTRWLLLAEPPSQGSTLILLYPHYTALSLS